MVRERKGHDTMWYGQLDQEVKELKQEREHICHILIEAEGDDIEALQLRLEEIEAEIDTAEISLEELEMMRHADYL